MWGAVCGGMALAWVVLLLLVVGEAQGRPQGGDVVRSGWEDGGAVTRRPGAMGEYQVGLRKTTQHFNCIPEVCELFCFLNMV